MKIAVVAITEGGFTLARSLCRQLPGAELLPKAKVAETFAENWHRYDAFISIMATGIVVRAIAPLLQDKRRDPCVLAADEKGQHVISLLSGHIGGGNELTLQVAEILGGAPVITTASDTLGLTALDLWAASMNLVAEKKDMTRASGILVNSGRLKVYSELECDGLPKGLLPCRDAEQADIVVSNRSIFSDSLLFCPRNLVVGTGCNRGTSAAEFQEALDELFADLGLLPRAVRNLASIDKKCDEEGLLAFGRLNSWPIDFYEKDVINRVTGVTISAAPLKAVGAIGVAEPCAILSAGKNRKPIQQSGMNIPLISRKRKWKNVTMAVAQIPYTLSEQVQDL